MVYNPIIIKLLTNSNALIDRMKVRPAHISADAVNPPRGPQNETPRVIVENLPVEVTLRVGFHSIALIENLYL